MSTARGLRVTDVVTAAGTTRAEVLRLAGALAGAGSATHPSLRAVATAVAEAEPSAGGTAAGVPVGGDGVVVGSAEVRELCTEAAPGTGVGGVVRLAHAGLQLGRRVLVGSREWLASDGVAPPTGPLERACTTADTTGGIALLVAWNGSVHAVVTLRA